MATLLLITGLYAGKLEYFIGPLNLVYSVSSFGRARRLRSGDPLRWSGNKNREQTLFGKIQSLIKEHIESLSDLLSGPPPLWGGCGQGWLAGSLRSAGGAPRAPTRVLLSPPIAFWPPPRSPFLGACSRLQDCTATLLGFTVAPIAFWPPFALIGCIYCRDSPLPSYSPLRVFHCLPLFHSPDSFLSLSLFPLRGTIALISCLYCRDSTLPLYSPHWVTVLCPVRPYSSSLLPGLSLPYSSPPRLILSPRSPGNGKPEAASTKEDPR